MRSITILLLGTLVSICLLRCVLAQQPLPEVEGELPRPPPSTGQVTHPQVELPRYYSEFGQIVGIETGWRDDTLAMTLDVNFRNAVDFRAGGLGPCGVITPEGHFQVATSYALDPKDPGVKLHEAVLLSAFLSGNKVRVLVQGCIYNKPRIIAVGIGQPFQ